MSASAMRYLPHIEATLLGELLVEWQGSHPGMGVLVLLPEAEKDSVPLIQAVCDKHRVPVVGAVFPALIAEAEFRSRGAWVLRFDTMPYTALYADLPRGPEAVAPTVESIVAELKPHLPNGDPTTLFMLFDAMVPDVGSLLDELYLRLANRVRYMGANAGSESFQPMPCLFDGSRVVERGVLLMLLTPHQGAILDHGYGVPPKMTAATSTEGNRILQIDWRPAFEVYQELARAQYGVEVNRDNFYEYAVHFPVGIVRANGVILVRIPVSLEEDGSLFCVGEVPPNSMLTLLEAPAVDSVHTIKRLVDGLAELNGTLAGRDLLLFGCAGRRMHLGVEAASRELQALLEQSGAAQMAGALSLGEIGSTTQWGYPLFHNAALVACQWDGA